MQLKKVKDLFDIQFGNGFELNALTPVRQGINFVARGMKDNGITARVEKVIGVLPFEAGAITVAASGSVMESFLQPEPFYTSYHVFVLTPKVEMSDAVKLYYCMCLRANKYKYSYGRQANETLPDLLIPSIEEIPDYVKGISLTDIEKRLVDSAKIDGIDDKADICSDKIGDELVPLSALFELHNGISSDKVLRSKRRLSENWIPFIRPSYRQTTSIDAFVNKTLIPSDKLFPKGTLYVSTDGQGSHTYSYISTEEFVPNSNICVLIPKREMCLREKLFYAMCITRNRFKFSYGRKPKGTKLSTILLPKCIPTYFNNLDLTSFYTIHNYIKKGNEA
ncbi:MAG: restriction endonuclease subunit S [Bacteroidales bacterium]|nr:restriction endonuclease subunit S [Bacteroidales bacterium]